MSNIPLAEKLEKMAATLQRQIERERRPMTQNATPKRLREYHSRLHDAANLERTRSAMLALAACHRNGGAPKLLAGLRSKDEIARLVHKRLTSHGYYEVSTEPDYADHSPAAIELQALCDTLVTPEEREAREEREAAAKIEKMVDNLRFADISGFFPTPPALVKRMVDVACVHEGMDVLEPSAGKGDIADALAPIVGKGNMVLCEISPTLCRILEAKGYGGRLVEGDFLERFSLLDPKDGQGEVSAEMQQFDRVLMNPPFEKGQDGDHIQYAYKLLRPGGRLVAIMSATAARKQNRRNKEFAEFLDTVGATVEPIDAGAFAGQDAFRRTGVSCCLVTIDKPPAKPPRSETTETGETAAETGETRKTPRQKPPRSVPQTPPPAAASEIPVPASSSNATPSVP
ncbi:MAG: hypothetical protein WBL72_19550, partial [Thermoguttaceae bacterium]